MLGIRFQSDVQRKQSALALIVILFSKFLKVSSNDRSIADLENDFKCASGTIIPGRFVCDGEFDCGNGDGSDEQNCRECQSCRGDDSSEELFGTEEVPEEMDQYTPKTDATVDDNLHDDVSAIGKSWYRRFSRSSGTSLDVPAEKESAMLEFLKIATYYLKLGSIKLESQYNLKRSEYTYPLVAFRQKRPNTRKR